MTNKVTGIVDPKTGEEVTPPESNELMVEVMPEDGEIVEVGLYSHKVIWVDGGLSVVGYCNNCGFFLKRGGDVMVSDGTFKFAMTCANCGCWMGFAEREDATKSLFNEKEYYD